VIYPWTPGYFSEQELTVIEEQWSGLAASQHLELVVQDHIKRGVFEGRP